MKAKIIGCGLSGIVASTLLKQKGYDVEIFDTRNHIGGNCYDENIKNITVHKYGLHIFHTNDLEVWNFVNQYTLFNNYVHRARANTKYGLISIPYNLKTEKQLGKELSETDIQNLIFKEYSERHWGIPWEKLPKSISSRLPSKRYNDDDRYFTDIYQGIPVNGYTNMMHNMLDGTVVHLDVNKDTYKKLLFNSSLYDIMIYTGKPDDYFDYKYGHLEYRSLRFDHYEQPKDKLFSFDQGSVINECNSKTFNRTVDNGVFLKENDNLDYSIYTKDYPEEHNEYNDPIYPKNFGVNLDTYNNYNKLMKKQTKTIFLGRLATYKYLDMWMAIKQVFNKLKHV